MALERYSRSNQRVDAYKARQESYNDSDEIMWELDGTATSKRAVFEDLKKRLQH